MARYTAISAVVMVLAAGWQMALADDKQLTAAISYDGATYVVDNASSGLEVDIVRAALPDHDVVFRQMAFNATRAALENGSVDMAVTVQAVDDGLFYSTEYIAFLNDAISRKSDGFHIDSVRDLVGHKLITWQGAYEELGPQFEALFAPGMPNHADYSEGRDPETITRDFWAGEGLVAVLDITLFKHYSVASGHAMDDVVVHNIFPPKTDFRVGFRSETIRDSFDAGVKRLCASGDYAAILKRYGVPSEATVCG